MTKKRKRILEDKFSYYDVIANIVPGLIALGLSIWLFAALGYEFKFNSPEILGVGVGLAVAYGIGHVIQAISSLFQPIYYFLWRGKPSDNLLSGINGDLGKYRNDIVEKLRKSFGIRKTENHMDEYREIFNRCMTLVNMKKLGRVEAFNASYAFHRALFTTCWILTLILTVVAILSTAGVFMISPESKSTLILFVVLGFLTSAIEFIRTKQRGYYYAREVIYIALQYFHTPDEEGEDN